MCNINLPYCSLSLLLFILLLMGSETRLFLYLPAFDWFWGCHISLLSFFYRFCNVFLMLPGRTGFLHLLLCLSSALFLVHSTFPKCGKTAPWGICRAPKDMSFSGILGQAMSPSWPRMATELLNGELPACTLGYTHSLSWLIPVLVCCPCCWSVVAQIAKLLVVWGRAEILLWLSSLCVGGIMSDPSKSHELCLEALQRQWVIWGSVIHFMWVVDVWPLLCVGLSQTFGEKTSKGLCVDHLRNSSDKTESSKHLMVISLPAGV